MQKTVQCWLYTFCFHLMFRPCKNTSSYEHLGGKKWNKDFVPLCLFFVFFFSAPKTWTTMRAVANSGAGFHHALKNESTVLRSCRRREVEAIKPAFYSGHSKRWYPSISQSLSSSQIKLPSHLLHSQHSTWNNVKRIMRIQKKSSDVPFFSKNEMNNTKYPVSSCVYSGWLISLTTA